jgi:hypothetical protein
MCRGPCRGTNEHHASDLIHKTQILHPSFTHYVDPSLRAILETALTPDDNDLFLSNLVDTPMLVIHGFVHLCPACTTHQVE